MNPLSSPQSPWSEPTLVPVPEPPAPTSTAPDENPPWSGWEVLQIGFLMVGAPILLVVGVAAFARTFVYHGRPWIQLAQEPILVLISELLAYVLVFFFMVVLVEGKYHALFLDAIAWNWPRNKPREVLGFVALGSLLLFGLAGISHFLPIPKSVPFDQLFKRPVDAYLTSIFAISLGPFMEELFFRGFLYPVCARRLGVTFGVFVTALAFGLLHAAQLGFAWGPIFVIFLVGVALTIVRALSHSVASSFLVHVAYNSTLTVVAFLSTDAFRHLEKLNR